MMISANSSSENLSNRVISAFHEGGISLEISAPYYAYPDGRITMITNLNTSESVRHVTLIMIVNGCKTEGYGNWSETKYVYKDQNFDAGIWPTVYTSIDVPHDISPYMVYCLTESSWYAKSQGTGENSSKSLCIEIIYLENVDYENLQNRYEVLEAEYITTRTFMNALAVTSLVFIGTTIYLTIGKRETKPK